MGTDRDEETRETVRRLLRAVEQIRNLYPRMELGQLVVFLGVIVDPGVKAKDLGPRVSLSTSAMSRNVSALSALSYLPDAAGKNRDGLDLITQIPDVFDRRAMALAPTRKGYTLAEKLAHSMKG
jgi:DNA-binding MarR family transcriptional regulator